MTCPRCQTERPEDAPGGLCPHCLAQAGLDLNLAGNLVLDAAAGVRPADSEPAAEAGVQGAWSNLSSHTPGPNQPSPTTDFGDYELLEEIARGGMGVVYKARQRSLNRLVAVKMVLGGPLASNSLRQRFLSEAQVVANLQHPNIVAIHEAGEHAGQPFFAMDYVQGRSLAEILRNGPLEPQRAAAYVKTIAEAVQYAHSRGILHRDLKPPNILIDASDQPRITDFGLAKRLDDAAVCTLEGPLTVTGQVLGSPNFMAPEQAQGLQRDVGPASDVYSMGALLYHLLTGRPPFQAATLSEVLRQVIATEPAPPRLLNADVPRDLETICVKCLEKDIRRRYPSAQALADELGRLLRGEPILARPLGRAGKAAKWCRRNPFPAAALGVALLSLSFGLAGIAWEWRRAEAEALVARRNAYAADMKEVQRALEDSNLGRARELLNRYGPAPSSASFATLNPRPPTELRGWEWRYYWSRCQSEGRFTLCRCSNSVSALAFSADGRWLAVRQRGGAISLWNAAAGRLKQELPGSQWDDSLAFSPRGNLLAWSKRNTNGEPVLSVLEASAQKEIASFKLPGGLRSVAFSPDANLIAALGLDGNLRVCEVASRQVVTQLVTGPLDLRFRSFRPSNATENPPVEAGGARGDLGTKAGKRIASNFFVQRYGRVLFSPDGRWLAVGEATPRIELLDRTTGKTNVIEIPAPADGISALAFSPDSRLLAAGCGAGTNDIHVWDLADNTVFRLRGQSGWVASLAFSPDGQTLASAGADQSLRLWDVSRQAERRRFQGSTDEIWALAWSPDGKNLVTGGRDGAVRYWDPAAKPMVVPYLVLPARVYAGALAFSPDSKSFLTVTQPEGEVLRWDADTLEVVERLGFLGTKHNSLALSKEAHWLALGDASGHVRVWDWAARRLETNLVFDRMELVGLEFSPQGLGCCGLSPRGGLALKAWRAPRWEELDLTGISFQGLGHAAGSPDGQMIAMGYEGARAVWWSLTSRRTVATFDCQGANGGGVCVAFSPDGKVFATAAVYGGVTLWDVASCRPRPTGRSFRDLLYRLAFSPDGRRVIASGTSPHAVLWVWDVATGRELAALPGVPGSYIVGFSPDGNTVWATANEGTALFWRAPSLEEIAQREKGMAAR